MVLCHAPKISNRWGKTLIPLSVLRTNQTIQMTNALPVSPKRLRLSVHGLLFKLIKHDECTKSRSRLWNSIRACTNPDWPPCSSLSANLETSLLVWINGDVKSSRYKHDSCWDHTRFFYCKSSPRPRPTRKYFKGRLPDFCVPLSHMTRQCCSLI